MTTLAQPVGASQSFIELAKDETVRRWLADLSSNSCSQKERKEIVKNLRSLIQECAAEQEKKRILSNSDIDAWADPKVTLPAYYEEVRILYDGIVRIARLGHSKEYFQLSNYAGSAKSQYVVGLEKVQGWQSIAGIPFIPYDEPILS